MQEEYETQEDGQQVIIKPTRRALARVSVLRGQGSMAGVPFIDDYIVTTEPVVDYLTRYSGIQHGDLDRTMSRHHLTTLKSAYVALRSLVDKGKGRGTHHLNLFEKLDMKRVKQKTYYNNINFIRCKIRWT